MILRAKIVVPVSAPPIENGAVEIRGNEILRVGRWEDKQVHTSGEVLNLGDVILLPGLVNAHCHLDYTGMAGKVPPPRRFSDWVRALVALKATSTESDYAESWKAGAKMLLQTGTTTVYDIEAVPTLIPAAWQWTPLRVISFRELIALRDQSKTAPFLDSAVNEWRKIERQDRVGLSPHAPYTTTANVLHFAANAARKFGWPLTTHVAESEEEFEMFLYRSGPLFDWLKSQRDMSDCGRGSPVAFLEENEYLGPHLLAVHMNYLWRHDATTLAKRGVSVVHCPRSHDYFRHLRFPRADLEDAGVNICLGTDSLATTRKIGAQLPELNMFKEMQAFSAEFPEVAPQAILKMATINAAQALGRKGHFGELAAGTAADLIAVPYPEGAASIYDAVIQHRGNVVASMIGGEWALKPGEAAGSN
jgi:cytosine/adenosine deaminase-related metal-dependent hydrolase